MYLWGSLDAPCNRLRSLQKDFLRNLQNNKLPEKLGLERQDAEHTIYITPEVPDAVLFQAHILGIYSNIPGDPIGFSHIFGDLQVESRIVN